MRRCYLSKTDICWLIWHFRSAKSRNFHQPTVGFGRQLHARADITLILLISAVFESLIETKTVKIKSQRYISPLKKDFYPITRNLDPIPKFCLISMRFHPMVKRGGEDTINQPLFTWFEPFSYQANIYLFKVNNRKTRKRWRRSR